MTEVVAREASPREGQPANLALVWDNLRPSHHDLIRALAKAGHTVTGIEFFGTSVAYTWPEASTSAIARVTLAADRAEVGALRLAVRLFRAVLRSGARHAFISHYERPAIFLAACFLRLWGRRVYTMLDSKFDDYSRSWIRSPIKALMMSPYHGAIVASRRSREYAAYLGVPRDRIEFGYDSLDLERLRALAGDGPLPPFLERPFIIVSRLIAKKNTAGALRAFAAYRRAGGQRRLVVIGDGPLAGNLRAEAEQLGISAAVDWRGAQPSEEVMRAVRSALALLLPSIEEQFGQVVLEGLALGVPVIVSNNVGAVDLMVDNLINGYVIDPHKPAELLAAMTAIDGDEAAHSRMSRAAFEASERGDARRFVERVERLIAPRHTPDSEALPDHADG